MGGTLTVSERIIYHLSNYVKYEDKFEVPFDVTQDGISQAISISRAHAAIELKKLRSSGTIEERLSHIKKGKSRRKAYFLTVPGKTLANTVVQYANDNAIDPRVDSSKVVPMTNAVARSKSSRKSSPLPVTKNFFGREKELSQLRRAFGRPQVKMLSLRGIAGIGKTATSSRFVSGLAGQRVFWYSVKPWDVPRTLMDAMARFFQENGCKKLATYLSSDHVEMGELSVLLDEELMENGYTFVFDDADSADGLQDFLRMFRHSSGTAKVLVTAENVPRFYEQSDVVVRKEIFEMELGGLDKRSSVRILESRGISGDSAQQLASLTKGHPLSLEMITVSGLSEARTQVARFLEEKYYAGLSDPERSLLQLASVFNRPFTADAIPRDLRGCRKGSMLRETAPGRFEIHSSIREFVYESMDPVTRASKHSAAADHYLREEDPPERLYHLLKANRFLEAEMLMERLGESLLDSGDVQRLWGVLKDYVPRKEKYSQSVQLLKAKVAGTVGDYRSAQALLESLVENAGVSERAEALIEMGDIAGKKGDLQNASRLLSEALDFCADSPGRRSKALRGLGVVENMMGNHRKARELLEASARDALAAVDPRGILLAHLELGSASLSRGLYEEAISHFSKCAAGFGPVDLAGVYMNMGIACARLGRPEEARQHLENAVRLSSETGQPRSRAYAHTALAETLTQSGEYEAARECSFAALEVFTELEDRAGASAAYAVLGKIERECGNLDGSVEHYKESLSALDGSGLPRDVALRKMEFADLLVERGDADTAKAVLEEAAKVFAECGAEDLACAARKQSDSLAPEGRGGSRLRRD